MPSQKYDVVVIGSGPGGYVAAAKSASLGFRVALVEKDKSLGGTCLHRGCIPTKAFLHVADTYDSVKNSPNVGIRTAGTSIDWPEVQKYKSKIVSSNALGVAHLMKSKAIEVFNGFGFIKDKNTVEVRCEKQSLLKTDYIILAVGSKPKLLPGMDSSCPFILTSDSILELGDIPSSLAIIGGGVIGVEFASAFSRLGTKVTIIEALPQVLAAADEDCALELKKELEKSGVIIHTGATLLDTKPLADGVCLIVKNDLGKNLEIKSQYVLVSVGRAPLTDNIGLENTAVKLERGYIKVNGLMQSDEPNIYGIGDCVNTPWLAHVASKEGIIASEAIARLKPKPFNYDHTPYCVYSQPEIAWAGITEKKAKELGLKVKVSKFDLARNGKAAILQKTKGFIKFIIDERYHEILGIHIVGPKATELLAEPSFAMQMEATIDDIAETMHAHPTLYESIYEAALMSVGKAVHG